MIKWTPAETAKLMSLKDSGTSWKDIAIAFQGSGKTEKNCKDKYSNERRKQKREKSANKRQRAKTPSNEGVCVGPISPWPNTQGSGASTENSTSISWPSQYLLGTSSPASGMNTASSSSPPRKKKKLLGWPASGTEKTKILRHKN